MPLHESVGLLSRSGVLWSTKVELYESIQANMELGAGRDAVEDPELTKRLVTVLLEGAGDAHFKVATAALQAIVAVLRSRHGRPIMGLYIDALVPSLFGRVADAKEQIRHLVGEAVAMLPQIFEADLVTQGLAAAMHTARAPKILCAIMNFFAELVECCPVGKRNTAFSSGGRSLLASCIALATNKNPDVRQCALTALASVYTRASPALVDSSLAALPISPQQAVSRALAHTLQDHAPAGLREPTVSPGLPPPPRAVSTSPGRVLLRRSDLFSPDISPTSEIATIHVGEFNRSYNPSSTPAQSESVSFMVADSPGGSMMSVSLDDKTGKLEVVNPKSVTIEVDATFGVQAGMASPSSFPSSPAKRSSVPNWSLPGVLSALQGQPTAETMERAAHLAPKLRNADDVKALALAVAEALSRVFNADEASADPRLQEASMDAFSSLAAELPLDDVARLAPSLLEGLIHAAASDREAVAYAAERAAEELMQRVDAVEALSMLIPLLPAAEARPPFDGAKAKEAGLVLRLLHAAAGRVSSTQLSAVMDMVMPSLCTCYTSPNASIRKGTVSCIVSFHKVR